MLFKLPELVQAKSVRVVRPVNPEMTQNGRHL